MKLPPARVSGFLQSPDRSARVVLIYGPDAGLVRERADALARRVVPDQHDPFRVAVLTPAAVNDDPARLVDEMAAQALGGGQRLIRIPHATEAVATALAGLISDMPQGDAVLLIEGGDLDKRSKLRSACENAGEAVIAIACYVEDGPARQRAVADILQMAGMRAARDVLVFLSEVLPSDRLAMRSEIEKLALYARGQTEVTLDDVRATVQDAGAAELDDLVFAVGLGDAAKARLLMDRLFEEQTSPVALLRAAQRHFLRLQWARGQMEGGLSASEAVKKLQPQVFWKYVDAMTAQVGRWSLVRTGRALERLYDAEAMVKRTGIPDETLCAQVMLGLAA